MTDSESVINNIGQDNGIEIVRQIVKKVIITQNKI